MTAEETIRSRAAALAAAINRGDAEAAASLYTEDGELLPPGAPSQSGIDAIRTFWAGAIEAGLGDLALETREVVQFADDALETGILSARMGGEEIAGKYVVHWKHNAQGWRLHRDIWNADA